MTEEERDQQVLALRKEVAAAYFILRILMIAEMSAKPADKRADRAKQLERIALTLIDSASFTDKTAADEWKNDLKSKLEDFFEPFKAL